MSAEQEAIDRAPFSTGMEGSGQRAYRELDAARAALPVAIRMAVDEAWWGKYPEDTAEHASTLREAIVAKVLEAMS